MKNKIALLILLIFAVLQLFTIDKIPYEAANEYDLFATEPASEEINKLIHTACYNCHSNQIDYPWYTNVAPLSWWIQDHIEEGREHLNFSQWNAYSNEKKAHKAEEAYEELEEKEMPLESYTFIHGDARLSNEQRKLLEDWFRIIEEKYKRFPGNG